jgi:UDP-N-acetylglucosamine transferase subunit ALG13
MTNRDSDFRFTVSPEAAASIHDDGIVILHLGSGSFYTCNRTGAHIWRAIEEKRSLEAIAEEISSTYEIALTTARQHTVRFLAELELHTLIQREAVS